MYSKPATSAPGSAAAQSHSVCASGDEQRQACRGQLQFGEYEGQPYCVLHFPATDKLKDFTKAINRKLKAGDFNFQGVWFPEAASFTGPFPENANFAETVFSDDISFGNVAFLKMADFSEASFQGEADFDDSEFVGAYFALYAHIPVPFFPRKRISGKRVA